MLNSYLYKINLLYHQNNTIKAGIELNGNHAIFNGHFPGAPVLPGACMLQMVKDLLEVAFNKPVRLKIAGNLKFVQMINPLVNNSLKLNLNYKQLNEFDFFIGGNLSCDNKVCFKIQATYITQ